MARRCKKGVNKITGRCLKHYRRKTTGKKKKGRGRAKDPQGSVLFKDVMAYARGGKRFACGSPERDDRLQRTRAYLMQLRAVEESNMALDPARAERRKRALDQTFNAARKILWERCVKRGSLFGPYARP